MKKTLLITATLITIVVIMAFTNGGDNYLPLYQTSAPAGYCGDPMGGGLTCKSCHDVGPSPTTQPGWITSNIPGTGYVPNTTYTITATASGVGHTRFGFEVSPQNSSGIPLGTLVITDMVNTVLTINNNNYVTHTLAGTTGTTGFHTWSFNWTAPAASSGAVTFYGAFNITNADNADTNDTIILSTLSVNEKITTGIAENQLQTTISAYPNPFSTQTTLQTDNFFKNATLTVYNSSGQQVKEIKNISGKTITLYRDNLPSGLYFIRTTQDNKTFTLDKLVITDN